MLNVAVGAANREGKLLMNEIPVALADQIFCRVIAYVTTSQEILGFSPVKTFVTTRSAIGVICATAEVSAVETHWSVPKAAVVVIGENDRAVVISLAVIVTEKLLFAGMVNIGSGFNRDMNPSLIGAILAF